MRLLLGSTAKTKRTPVSGKWAVSSFVRTKATSRRPAPTRDMELEFASIQESLLKVERDIAKTEREIDEVVEDLKRVDPADAERQQYLRKEKEQLRKEKEQLRGKEEQLRREKELRLQNQLETPVSLAPQFISLLKMGHITNPNDKVIGKILTSFFKEMHASMVSVDSAVAFYRSIKELPSTITMCIVEGQVGVRIMGPLSSEKPKLFTGRRPDGTAIVVKLLYDSMDDARQLKDRVRELEREAECCKDLALDNESIALVRHEVVDLEVPVEFVSQTRQQGKFKALLMPRYVESLARSGVYPVSLVAREASRITAALKYMHSHGYVHMDVKGDNVFVDFNGAWFLGDFGSACGIGEPIRTSTPIYYHCGMGPVALPKYDWFMLLVLLMVELEEKDKNRWVQRLVAKGESRVCYDLVMQEADKAIGQEALPKQLRDAVAEVKDLYLSAER